MLNVEKLKRIALAIVMILSTIGVLGINQDASIGVTVAHAAVDPVGNLGNLNVTVSGDKMEITGADDSTEKALKSALTFIKWLTLAGTLLLLGVFIVNLLKLGASGTNVQARAAAQQGLIWSGISAAILSIASTVFFFLSGIFTKAD